MKQQIKISLLTLVALFAIKGGMSQNPIITNLFTADPAPIVYNNTVLINNGTSTTDWMQVSIPWDVFQ